MSNAAVTVTATTTTTKVAPNIRFDSSYAKTVPGILKIATAVTCLIGFICVQTVKYASYTSAGGWYTFTAMTGFWVQLLLVLGYMFHLIEKLHWIPWLIGEFGFCALWTVFFFIAACVAASWGSYDPGWGAAAFFGFAAMLLFGYEAFMKYKGWRGGEIAQGERTVTNNPTTSPTGPSYPTY